MHRKCKLRFPLKRALSKVLSLKPRVDQGIISLHASPSARVLPFWFLPLLLSQLLPPPYNSLQLHVNTKWCVTCTVTNFYLWFNHLCVALIVPSWLSERSLSRVDLSLISTLSFFLFSIHPHFHTHSLAEISSNIVCDEQAITFTHHWMYKVSPWRYFHGWLKGVKWQDSSSLLLPWQEIFDWVTLYREIISYAGRASFAVDRTA